MPSVLSYRDVAPPPVPAEPKAISAPVPKLEAAPAGPSAEEIEAMVTAARLDERAMTEARVSAAYEDKLKARQDEVRRAIDGFATERTSYFHRVEAEVVHLALAIAAKILHREASVEPMLIAALVRVAVEKMRDGSSVSVRTTAADASRWRTSFEHLSNGAKVTLVEDPQLMPGECILETELGSASFGIEAQLKEVEQGFCDLLAHRPAA